MRFSRIGQVLVHYELDGDPAGPPIVFVNSLGTDLRIWDDVVPHLGEYRLIRYDKRGHGLSDSPEGPYTLADFGDDLAGLLDELEVEKVLVVGISIGGMIALEFAARYGERVRGLVLADTAPQVGTPSKWQERMDGVVEKGMERMAREILPVWFRPSFEGLEPDVHRGHHNMLARMPAGGYAASCAALRDGDLRTSIPQIDTQALVLNGDQDVATPPDEARMLADALPNARFAIIDEAGHLTCVEQPDDLADAIHRFAQEIGHE